MDNNSYAMEPMLIQILCWIINVIGSSHAGFIHVSGQTVASLNSIRVLLISGLG